LKPPEAENRPQLPLALTDVEEDWDFFSDSDRDDETFTVICSSGQCLLVLLR